MRFSKRFHKIIFRRKNRWTCDKDDHNLSCRKASADQHMTQKSITCVLIICPDFKWFQHSTNRPDNLLTLLVFNQTILHRHYSVCAFFVNTGNNISFPVTVKYRMHFIPVIIWILHSDDWTDLPVCSKKTLFFFLLFLKLLFIRNTLKLAATTFLRYITFHNFQLTCYRSYTVQTVTLLFHL